MDAAHPTRLTGTAANPLPAPPSPGLEQQQGEKEEEEQGCPMEPRSHRVVPHRDLVWAQPHPDKAVLTQALLGSLPSQAKPGVSGDSRQSPAKGMDRGQPRNPEGM